MNIGTTIADLGSTSANEAQIDELSKYFRCARFGVDIQNSSQITRQKAQAIYAKSKGMRVIFLTSAPSVGGTGFTSTFSTNTFQPAVLDIAEWCEANGMDELTIANEEELRLGSGIADPFALVASHYKPLATAVKAVYSGIVSFCISNGAESWIFNITPGDVDRVGFNSYGDLAGSRCSDSSFRGRIARFKANANWGDRLYISEFNCDFNGTRFQTIAANDDGLTREIARKFEFIVDQGIEDIYPFCWKYSSGNDDFSMKKNDGSYRGFLNPLVTRNGRSFFVNL